VGRIVGTAVGEVTMEIVLCTGMGAGDSGAAASGVGTGDGTFPVFFSIAMHPVAAMIIIPATRGTHRFMENIFAVSLYKLTGCPHPNLYL